MISLIINFLALSTLVSSIFCITSKNPVISVILLISTFVQAAIYLIIIGINFIGISYIVIYVGAIAILFLFVIMMINIKLTDILETGNQYTKNLPLAISIGSLFIYIIFTLIHFNFNNVPALSFLLDKITIFNYTLSNNTEGSFNLINSIINNNLLTSLSDIFLMDFIQIEVLGHGMYTYGAVLLITLSVILLLAMFATIVLSKSINIKIKKKIQNIN